MSPILPITDAGVNDGYDIQTKTLCHSFILIWMGETGIWSNHGDP